MILCLLFKNLYTLEPECIGSQCRQLLSANWSKSFAVLPGALNGSFLGVADG